METKRAAANGLAVVGFITLVFLAVVLAGNAARFIPTIVNNTVEGLTAAVVGVTSIFVEDENVIVINDDPTPTEPKDDTPDFPTPPEDPAEEPVDPTPTTPVTPTPGDEEVDVITQPGGPVIDPNGRPDLVPVVLATGKLVGGFQAENFVATNDLHKGDRIAVRFQIENRGTNVTGSNWSFQVVMPTENTFIFEAQPGQVQNLNPGEKIEYVIGFDRAKVGQDLQISIAADHKNTLVESNENNNGAFAKITVVN